MLHNFTNKLLKTPKAFYNKPLGICIQILRIIRKISKKINDFTKLNKVLKTDKISYLHVYRYIRFFILISYEKYKINYIYACSIKFKSE